MRTAMAETPAPEAIQGPKVIEERRTNRAPRSAFRFAGTRQILGIYDTRTRTLEKRIKGGVHIYGNRPGLALNMAMLEACDRKRPRPKAVRVTRTDLKADGTPRAPYVLEWAVARAFLVAAMSGDERFLVRDSVDDQVLIPWPAWAGVWKSPADWRPPEPEPETVEVVTPTLF